MNNFFSVFENNQEVVAVDDSPVLHPIDDMPLVRSVGNLMQFSIDDDNGDLINFSDTTQSAIDLIGVLDLSASFSWLFGSNDQIDIDDIITSFNGENADDGARAVLPNCSFGNLSPLTDSGTDFSFEYKRLFGHLGKVRRQLSFSEDDD